MVKLTNLSTAHIAIQGGNLAPGQSKNVEYVTASVDKLIQSGALKMEPVHAPVTVKATTPPPVPSQFPKPFKSKEKN